MAVSGKIKSSTKAQIFLGLLVFGLMAPASDAFAQSNRETTNRLNRIENELETLGRAVYKGEQPAPPPIDTPVRGAGAAKPAADKKKPRHPFRQMSDADIELLGCLPDRTTYLQGEGANILRAPAYAGLQDEVNQTHYMQIMHDMKSTTVQGVAFSDKALAAKIFPNGEMTPETEALPTN